MSKYNWSTSQLEELKKQSLSAQHIVLFPHTSPDGDALGCILAWANLLKVVNPTAIVQVISPDPVEAYLLWLPDLDQMLTYPEDEALILQHLQEADLLVHLDHNQVSRLRYPALIEAVYASSAYKVLIDHHLDPEALFDLAFSYPEASATCELVYRLAADLGWREYITPATATLLLTGIITDTGRFMYGHLCQELFSTAGDLFALGADYATIIDRLSYHNPEKQLRLQGYVLANKLDIYPDLRAACITLSQEELVQFNATKGDTEGLVNLPLSIEGVECCCFIREDKTQIKLSFRSTGNYPVNRLASDAFGGGGHLNAAGAEYAGSINEAKNIYLCALERLRASTPEVEDTPAP